MNKKAAILPAGILFLLVGIALLIAGFPRAGGTFAASGIGMIYYTMPKPPKKR